MVTGGMGFVGSHLCESLVKENHDLIILTKSLKKKHNVESIKTKVKQEKIDVTNFIAQLLLRKKKLIYYNVNFDKQLNQYAKTKYKKDKYEVINIIKLALSNTVKSKKFEISKEKYIKFECNKECKFKYISKKKVKSEGYIRVKNNILQALVDTKNNVKIVLQ